MRGLEAEQPVLFSYVNLESRVPRDHPLRIIKTLVDTALRELSPRFDTMCNAPVCCTSSYGSAANAVTASSLLSIVDG